MEFGPVWKIAGVSKLRIPPNSNEYHWSSRRVHWISEIHLQTVEDPVDLWYISLYH